MQDALLCYYIVANMLHAGYFADAMNLLRRAGALGRSFFSGSGAPPERPLAQAPALFREMEEWAHRLTRMESYVASMA